MSTPSNKSIIKAFNLVEVVCNAPDGLSLREAACAAQLSLSTTHRILNTLKGVGAISASPDGIYTLGPRLLALHERKVRAERAVYAVVDEHIAGLLRGPAMSVRLSVLDMAEIVIVAGVDSGVPARMRSKIGGRYEAYCTAPGKVLLSALSLRKLDDYVFGMGFVALTPNTIVLPSRLANEIKRVNAVGYAVDDGEFIEGVRCLSVPVRLPEGNVVAALSVAAEAMRLDDIPRLVSELTASAKALAEKLCLIPGGLRALQHSAAELVPDRADHPVPQSCG